MNAVSETASAQAAPKRAGKRGTYRKTQGTREAILAAARAVAGKLGLAQTTMEAIARHAGVSMGLAYYHFESRDQLLDELMDQFVAEHYAVEQLDGSGEEDFFVRIANRLRGYIAHIRRNPEYMALFEELRSHRPDVYRRSIKAVTARTENELRTACERGEIVGMDTSRMKVVAFVMLGTGYFMDQLLDGLSDEDYPGDDLVIQTYVDLIRRGIELNPTN